MDLSASLQTLPGIGPALYQKLHAGLGLTDIYSLLTHLPFRYEDRSRFSAAATAQPGESATFVGTLTALKNEMTHRGRFIQVGELTDDTGPITVIWFNQVFLTRTLPKGSRISVYGKVDYYKHHRAIISPDYEIHSPILLHTGRIIPVYPETRGLTSKWLRSRIWQLLSQLPEEILPHPPGQLPSWHTAVSQLHFPDSLIDPYDNLYRSRLSYDELLLTQVISQIRKSNWVKTKLTHRLKLDLLKVNAFMAGLPFQLTSGQNQAVSEILSDLQNPTPMNRLLEGDVGSGKTVVAAIAAYVSFLNGFQTIILAPTQILAQQHYQTLTGIFQNYGFNISLVTASQKKLEPSSHITIGTHALLNKQLSLDKVGLLVIDEQHRFGVAQRSLAMLKGETPHTLTMTATPIPRSLALTIHGDLDLSVISHLPQNRRSVKTWIVSESKRDSAIRWIGEQLTTSRTQAFWICPFIEVSETLTSVKAVTVEFEKLKQAFPNHRLGLLHGRLKSAEKNAVMEDFKQHRLDILVSTPIVEVGIDIPNAAIMVIEAPERFGLAQLHQLRGRVGRGGHQSYCLLFGPPTARLQAMEIHHSGLELAEIDLKLRGPGELYGTSQHGLPSFRIASYSDLSLIEATKLEASHLAQNLSKYPLLRNLVPKDKIDLVQPN